MRLNTHPQILDHLLGMAAGGTPYRALNPNEIQAVLKPLQEHLNEYDSSLQHMRQRGGTIGDLRRLGKLLDAKIGLETRPGIPVRVSLAAPSKLRSAMSGLAPGLRLDIRTGDHGFPSHYLYRTSTDYFGEFSLILEDYFRSPGFESSVEEWDPVASTTRYGQVQRLLRLSPFRPAAAQACTDLAKRKREPASFGLFGLFGDIGSTVSADQLLYDAGRHIFDAAWHDDQRLAFAACRLLDMPRFRQALELFYLCLGGDLTRLRSLGSGRRGDALKSFFRNGYPQPCFIALINRLVGGEGATVSLLRTNAEGAFLKLGAKFSKLMQTRGGMDGFPGDPPLYKIMLANYHRVDRLSSLRNSELVAAGSTADADAWDLATDLLKS